MNRQRCNPKTGEGRSRIVVAVILAAAVVFSGSSLAQGMELEDLKKTMSEVAEALFAPETDLVALARKAGDQDKDAAVDPSGTMPAACPRQVQTLKVPDSGRGIQVGDVTCDVVLSDLPPLVPGISAYQSQALARDAAGVYIRDEELIFKCLATWRIREYFQNMDRNTAARKLGEAAEALDQVRKQHRNANYAGIAQKVLSEVLTHYVTSTPYLPQEIMNPENARALNAALCEAELRRYSAQLREVAQRLQAMDPLTLSYEQASRDYALFADSVARIEGLNQFADQTFPVKEGGWTKRTASLLLLDFLDLLGPIKKKPGNQEQADLSDLEAAAAAADVKLSSLEARAALRLLVAAGKFDNSLIAYLGSVRDREDLVPIPGTWVEAGKIAQTLVPAGQSPGP